LLALATLAWSYAVAVSQPVVRQARIALPGLAPQQRLRLVLLSDLHVAGPDMPPERLAGIVAMVNDLRPDLVLIAGDFVSDKALSTRRYEAGEAVAPLAALRAPLGRYAVLGNHDWHERGAAMPRALRAAGITVLENDAVRADDAGAPLWIAGVADAVTRTPRLDDTLGVVPADEAVLLLSHNPDVFPHVPERVALTLAGHTHGAQVDLPVLRDRVTPSRHGARYTNGHQVEAGRHLFVSPGVGTSSYPVRFRARPEVTLIRLAAGPGVG
jgi:predicted MPP superfamily phosphohydrolase